MNSLRVRALCSAAKSAHSRGSESPSASRSASPVRKKPEKPAAERAPHEIGNPARRLAVPRAPRAFAVDAPLSFHRAAAME